MIIDLNRLQRVRKVIHKDATLYEICKRLKQLKDNGMSDNDINNVIIKMELPLKVHLFVTGYFSDLMSLEYLT